MSVGGAQVSPLGAVWDMSKVGCLHTPRSNTCHFGAEKLLVYGFHVGVLVLLRSVNAKLIVFGREAI